MMSRLENAILTGLRVGWQFLDVVKPVRTIDELARLAIDVWNREDEQVVDQDLHGQLAAAHLARRSVVSMGGDEEALAKVDERINVMSAFSSPASAQYDVLAGSISTTAGGQTVVGRHDPSLMSVGQRRTPAGIFDAVRGPGRIDRMWGHLEGQREALQLMRRSLSTTEQQSENAQPQVNTLLNTRRAALDAVAANLATRRGGRASPGPAGERQTRAPMPAPNWPTARPTAQGRPPQRINISPGVDRRQ